MTDYNTRQFKLMVEMLNAFDEKLIGLHRLVSSLSGLQNALEDMDAVWKISFQKQLAVLDDVYADAGDRNIREIPESFTLLVQTAVQEIRKLVAERA